MLYFKITDKDGDEMYGSTNADKEHIDLEKLKNLLCAEIIEEVSKEEYDAQDDDEK